MPSIAPWGRHLSFLYSAKPSYRNERFRDGAPLSDAEHRSMGTSSVVPVLRKAFVQERAIPSLGTSERCRASLKGDVICRSCTPQSLRTGTSDSVPGHL